jgi:hypothetical protein
VLDLFFVNGKFRGDFLSLVFIHTFVAICHAIRLCQTPNHLLEILLIDFQELHHFCFHGIYIVREYTNINVALFWNIVDAIYAAEEV